MKPIPFSFLGPSHLGSDVSKGKKRLKIVLQNVVEGGISLR